MNIVLLDGLDNEMLLEDDGDGGISINIDYPYSSNNEGNFYPSKFNAIKIIEFLKEAYEL